MSAPGATASVATHFKSIGAKTAELSKLAEQVGVCVGRCALDAS